MDTFSSTSPLGQNFNVDAPYGATRQQAFSSLQQHLSNADVGLSAPAPKLLSDADLWLGSPASDLPAGFVLDAQSNAAQELPPGFVLDRGAQSSQPNRSPNACISKAELSNCKIGGR